MTTTDKTYKNRFGNFKAGVCPYCSSRTATLKEVVPGRRYVGKCLDCHAVNNFTNAKCKEWFENEV